MSREVSDAPSSRGLTYQPEGARPATRQWIRSDAWPYLGGDVGSSRIAWRGHFARINQQPPAFDPVVIFKQPAFRRARSARTILIVSATMTWAHKEARLRKPANRTSEVRAVDGEDLEFLPVHIANPAGDIGSISIGWIHHRIAISGEASLAGRELFEVAKWNPRLIASLTSAGHRREEITHNRNGKNSGNDSIEEDSDLHQHISSREATWERHRASPAVFATLG